MFLNLKINFRLQKYTSSHVPLTLKENYVSPQSKPPKASKAQAEACWHFIIQCQKCNCPNFTSKVTYNMQIFQEPMCCRSNRSFLTTFFTTRQFQKQCAICLQLTCTKSSKSIHSKFIVTQFQIEVIQIHMLSMYVCVLGGRKKQTFHYPWRDHFCVPWRGHGSWPSVHEMGHKTAEVPFEREIWLDEVQRGLDGYTPVEKNEPSNITRVQLKGGQVQTSHTWQVGSRIHKYLLTLKKPIIFGQSSVL